MPKLDWLNRDAACRITAQMPTRVLRPHQAMPAGVGETGPAGGGKLLIQGDNLAALKALLPFYRGRPCAWPPPAQPCSPAAARRFSPTRSI